MVVTGRLDQRSWETQEGERRSKVEITAEEIAPSLRWATVQITRNERRSPEVPSAEAHAAHEPTYSRPAPEAAASAPAPTYSPSQDEEPF